MLTRREMIKRGFWAPALLAGATSASARGAFQDPSSSPAVQPFTRRLKIPRPHLPLNRPGATALEMAKAQSISSQCLAESRYRHEP